MPQVTGCSRQRARRKPAARTTGSHGPQPSPSTSPTPFLIQLNIYITHAEWLNGYCSFSFIACPSNRHRCSQCGKNAVPNMRKKQSNSHCRPPAEKRDNNRENCAVTTANCNGTRVGVGTLAYDWIANCRVAGKVVDKARKMFYHAASSVGSKRGSLIRSLTVR